MIPRSRFFDRSTLLGLAVLSLSLLIAGAASARTETLRWSHAEGSNVQSWEAHLGSTSGSYDRVVPLGTIQPNSQGLYVASVEVGDNETVFVSIRAIGDGRVSPLSNERQRSPAPANSPPPPPSDGSVAVGGGTTMPSADNAIHRQDFASNSLGVDVSGWLSTGPNFSLSEDASQYGVADLDGNRVLATGHSDPNIHSHWVGGSADWSDVSLTGRFAMDRDSVGFGVTLASGYPSVDGYYRLGRDSGGAFEISGRPGLSCTNPSTGVTPEPGVWYEYQFDAVPEAGGTRIAARVWRQGQSKPSGPQAECVDPSAAGSPFAGTYGVWSTGEGEKFWDDFEISSSQVEASAPLAPPVLIQIIVADE